MSYDPNFPFNNGQAQGNPEPDDDPRTVPMQSNFETVSSSQPMPQPSDYDAPTVAYGQNATLPEPTIAPMGNPSQGFAQPGMNFQGTMPPATTKPPKKQPSKKMLLIGGVSILVLLLLVIGVLLILPNLTASASNQATNATPVAAATPAANATKPANRNIYTPYLARYRSTIRSQIAQGLHLPVDQLETQLKGGATLSSMATTQGISTTQLQTIIKSAFQQGFQPSITSGELTQKQVNTLITRMLKQPQTLDRFLAVQAKSGNGAKKSATPTV
ncbi:hypothetical protein [Dictyobacter kobayashii]|uniref:Uncharacterized protein n=1 Tax=Dictyobacter kobayashii TaxID=2014872 RepID=A0A402AAZ6_9CHLR|nr:hypothetical protein [Dictyobacter kobayashii]GCE16290.1 hypothetical protein KDK_00900 [Dictyobacter kobayashii]